MPLDKIIHRLLNTTENTYSLYEKIAKKSKKDELEDTNEVFKTVSTQRLIEKHITPSIDYANHNTFKYKKGLDDKNIKNDELEPYQYDNLATLNWIKRKRLEIEKIRLNPIEKGILYPTLKLKANMDQLFLLLQLLKDCVLIDKKTTINSLKDALSGNDIEEKPQIIFLKKPQVFTYLLLKLKLNECYKYNETIFSSELFVYKDRKPIKDIKSNIDDYKHREEEKFKPYHTIEDLHKGLKDIFDESQLLKFPYKSKS